MRAFYSRYKFACRKQCRHVGQSIPPCMRVPSCTYVVVVVVVVLVVVAIVVVVVVVVAALVVVVVVVVVVVALVVVVVVDDDVVVVAVVVTVHLRTNPYQVFSTSTGTWHWRSYVHGWADATHRVVELRCS